MARAFRVSPFRIRTFNRCRLLYRFRYVDRIPLRAGAAQTVGAHVHAALKDFFTPVVPHLGGGPPAARTPERLVGLLMDRWSAKRAAFADAAEEEWWRDYAVRALRRFCAERDLTAMPLLLEGHLEADVAEGVRLFGRVDRVDEEADGALHVIDYKTGTLPGAVDGAQLRLYAMLLERRLARPVSRVSYWFLGDGATWSAPVLPEDREAAARDVVETVAAMRVEREYPAQPGAHCESCGYRRICPEWGERRDLR